MFTILRIDAHASADPMPTERAALAASGRTDVVLRQADAETPEQLIAAAAAFPALPAPERTGQLDAQTKASLAVFQRLTGSPASGMPDAQTAEDLAGMQFLLQHETSTRFVQFPGRTLMRGMQDMEVHQA